jgi:glycine dehydrogenase subunit 2
MYIYDKKNNFITNKSIFEYQSKGKSGIELSLPSILNSISEKDIAKILGHDVYNFSKKCNNFPEMSEFQVVRHFTSISRNNFCIDTNTYPLGSCTMKYNPRINEWVAGIPYFNTLHPHMDIKDLQFALSIIWDVQQYLKEVSGFYTVSLQPAAGAHSEFTGLSIMKKSMNKREEKRGKILVPDTAHGTNPATAKMLNLDVVNIKSNKNGYLCKNDILQNMDRDVLGIMITNPNTLGVFEKEIKDIADIVHEKGGYVYGDGANLNALMGYVRPGDIGFDLLHFNLHKTFSTPHGGGGPGCGAIGVHEELASFVPMPIIKKDLNNSFYIERNNISVGYIKSYYPNFSIVLRAWTYIRSLGPKGLKEVTSLAVLNANYVKARIRKAYHLPYIEDCLHEVVISDKKQKLYAGITALDIAKRLMDYNIHPPTIYFPLNVPGAIMIEPTETESKDTLDDLCNILIRIADEVKNNPEVVKEAPHITINSRPDEASAVKNPILTWL